MPDVSGLQWAEDGSLPPAANAGFFRAWFKSLGATAAANLQDAHGLPNAEALRRAKAALLYRAYGDERLVTATTEDVNPDNRNVLNALAQAAPALATLDNGHPLTGQVRRMLVSGLQTLRAAAERGLSVHDMLAQGDMLGRGEAADEVARFMAANARSAGKMAAAFKAIAEYAENAIAGAATVDIFGNRPSPSLKAALDYANARLAENTTQFRTGGLDGGADVGVAESRGDSRQRADEGQRGTAAGDAAPSGLFGAPTARELVDAARRDKDAARNGLNRDLVRPEQGEGDLLAGDRPAQADIEDGPLESVRDDGFSEEGRRQFRDTERAHGGKPAYDKAKAQGRTKLTFGQWVQVRTPNFKRWFGDWEALQNRTFLEGKPVAVMTGAEVPANLGKMKALAEWVANDWQHRFGGKAKNAQLGEVTLDKRAASHSAGHGMSAVKQQAFYLAPDIIEKGRVLGQLEKADPTKPDAFLIGAPVRIGDAEYYGLVEVRRDANGQRLYVHEAVLRPQKTPVDVQVAAASQEGAEPHAINTGAIAKLLREVLRVNPATVSAVTDPETGEPMVVRDGRDLVPPDNENLAGRWLPVSASIPRALRDELGSWDYISQSPYSFSFYSKPGKSWTHTPEGSLRISDHWNFESGGEIHARTC